MTVQRVDLSCFKPEVVYTHKGDLDGVVCAMIALDRFPGVRIVPLNYDELDQVRETPCLVMDLALPAEHPLVAAQLEEAGPEQIGHDGETPQLARVVIVDHHRATWYPPSFEEALPEGAYRQYAFGPGEIGGAGITLFHNPERCAAMIALGVLSGVSGAARLAPWVTLANSADLWREREESFARARALTAVVHQAGFDFCLCAWLGMLPSDPGVAGMGAAAVVAEKRANERAIQAAIASMGEEEDHVLGVCVAGSISHVAHGVLWHRRKERLSEKPVALVIVESLLGEGDQVAVGVRGPGALEVARRFGGGGHPESAGFQVPRCRIVPPMLESVREWEGASELGAVAPTASGKPDVGAGEPAGTPGEIPTATEEAGEDAQ